MKRIVSSCARSVEITFAKCPPLYVFRWLEAKAQGRSAVAFLIWSRFGRLRRMRRFLLLIFAIVFAIPLLTGNVRGQSAVFSETAQSAVVLSKLSRPIYPAIARTARISGDVELKLGIRKDGSVQSVEAISGPAMLKQAALDSAQKSQFECRGCGDETTWYSLIYSFQLAAATEAPTRHNDIVEVVPKQNRVTITAPPAQIIIDFALLKARSAKCLYLWYCGSRWGGEDYYFYRVRSGKCLYLWKCGLHRRAPSGS